MKTILKTISTTAFLGILAPILVLAQSPSLPHQFFGMVKFTDGVAVSNGRTVEAKINGVVVGSSVTSGGNYGYNPNLLFAIDNEGAHAGKTVEFYIGGVKANETAIFAKGNSSQKNLTIPATLTTSTPNSTSSNSGGGASTPNTPTSPLSATAQKVDANKDGKIDVLDFNSLMVNWGKTGLNNIADFNGNGNMDVFDFNLLMINWTL